MKKLILISLVIFFVFCSKSWALPECEGSPAYVQIPYTFSNCIGTITFRGEDKYVGEFKNYEMHGQASYIWADGKVWQGQFKDDEWINGKKYAAGEYNFLRSASGRIYIGVFKDGIFEGKNESDVKYVGEYKDGTMNGQGTYTFPSGDKYVGENKNGNFHGQGTFTSADGAKYVGEYKDGKMHGQGTITFADGKKSVGEFIDGKCPNCKKYAAGEYTGDQGGRIKREKKSKEIEQSNDNIRIALDALNYTFTGNKKERKTIVLDAENCIFEKERYWVDLEHGISLQYDKLYLNNVIFDTIKFYNKTYYNEFTAKWMDSILISFSGDEKVFYHGGFQDEYKEYEEVVSDSANLERVKKAWGVIYSRACKGASAGEF